MDITTSLSSDRAGGHYVREERLLDLIGQRSFVAVVLYLWRGTWPSAEEEQLMNAVLVAAIEHGVAVPSGYVPRVVASVGNEMRTALAAGMLSIGKHHGGAIAGAGALLADETSVDELVSEAVRERRRLPGYGHRVYKDEDPRARTIHDTAKELGLAGTYFERAYGIEAALAEAKGRVLPLNIDGAMAAALLELQLDARLSEAVFLLSRMGGMAAHVLEEFEQGNPYYRLSND